jgi:hypothetical protein
MSKRGEPSQGGAAKAAWQRFLEPLVGRERPVSVARLDSALRDLTGREGDARGEIYAYLRAQQKVGAQRAFFIGEALRECGITWSSGPIALASACLFADLVALFALLSKHGEGEETRAVIIAAACAVMTCHDLGNAELTALQNDTRRRLAGSSVASGGFVRATWEALGRKADYGRVLDFPTSPWLADAYTSAHVTDEGSRARRVFEDLGRWAMAFAQRDLRLERIIAPRFERRAEVEHHRGLAYFEALREALRRVAEPPSFDDVLPPPKSGVSAKLRMPAKGVKHS